MTDTIVLVSGASSGFGALTARALAAAGHTVYAGIRDTSGRNAPAVDALKDHATQHDVDLRAIELDVTADASVTDAVASIVKEHAQIDVVVHNAGHMVTGPAEAFTPEQLSALYDVNVLGAQRINRAVLPHLRAQRDGLLVWVGSSSTRGGTPPYLGPYFAAKAAMDALAVSYAGELTRFGIETTIVIPGAFASGTNHFAHAGSPADTGVATAYEEKYAGVTDQIGQALAEQTPSTADVNDVAAAIAAVVDTPRGQRPFRVHVDPFDDGSEVVNAVADRVRSEYLHRIGLADLLTPAV